MLRSIQLKNYKGFEDSGEIVFKPVTILFGKNSSGKSSICKLLPVLRDALQNSDQPLPLVSKEGVRIAYRYEDLFRNLMFSDILEFDLKFRDGTYVAPAFVMREGEFYNKPMSANYDGRVAHVRRIRFSSVKGEDVTESIGNVDVRVRNKSKFILNQSSDLQSKLKDNQFNVNFIGPIRSVAPHFISKSDAYLIKQRDANGEYTYHELTKSACDDNALVAKVSEWFTEHMDGYEIVMNQVFEPLMDGFVPSVKKGPLTLHLSEVGEGITQVLPIITQSFLEEPNTFTVLEQPALHLHPAVHAAIAERLALSSKETGQKYVIESHSHNLLLGFQRMVANPNIPFNSDDIIIYFVDSEDGKAVLKPITIDPDGTLSDWPAGVFEEDFELTKKIIDKI